MPQLIFMSVFQELFFHTIKQLRCPDKSYFTMKKGKKYFSPKPEHSEVGNRDCDAGECHCRHHLRMRSVSCFCFLGTAGKEIRVKPPKLHDPDHQHRLELDIVPKFRRLPVVLPSRMTPSQSQARKEPVLDVSAFASSRPVSNVRQRRGGLLFLSMVCSCLDRSVPIDCLSSSWGFYLMLFKAHNRHRC